MPLNPLEVMFVKVKDFQLEGNWMSTHLAATYGRWLEEQVTPPLLSVSKHHRHQVMVAGGNESGWRFWLSAYW